MKKRAGGKKTKAKNKKNTTIEKLSYRTENTQQTNKKKKLNFSVKKTVRKCLLRIFLVIFSHRLPTSSPFSPPLLKVVGAAPRQLQWRPRRRRWRRRRCRRHYRQQVERWLRATTTTTAIHINHNDRCSQPTTNINKSSKLSSASTAVFFKHRGLYNNGNNRYTYVYICVHIYIYIHIHIWSWRRITRLSSSVQTIA